MWKRREAGAPCVDGPADSGDVEPASRPAGGKWCRLAAAAAAA